MDTLALASRRWRWFGGIALLTFALDQVTKLVARHVLIEGKAVSVIDGFWDWYLTYNTGAAFSFLGDATFGRVILTVVAFAAVGIIFYMAKSATTTRAIASLAAILGGTVGNLVDRVAMGKVTDFVLWRYHEHEWPIFNIADIALCVGVGVLLLDMFATRHDDEAPASSASESG